MKKIWLTVATGILGMLFASSLVWSQVNAGVTVSQVIRIDRVDQRDRGDPVLRDGTSLEMKSAVIRANPR